MVEPEGWTLDALSARQLANVILYPQGEDWRRAPSLISVHLEPRRENQTVEDYVGRIGQEFEKHCPPGEHSKRESDLKSPFSLYNFSCPGAQDEIVAVTSVPDYFVNISLSTQQTGTLEEHFSVLKVVLESFKWQQELSQPALITPNRP